MNNKFQHTTFTRESDEVSAGKIKFIRRFWPQINGSKIKLTKITKKLREVICDIIAKLSLLLALSVNAFCPFVQAIFKDNWPYLRYLYWKLVQTSCFD